MIEKSKLKKQLQVDLLKTNTFSYYQKNGIGFFIINGSVKNKVPIDLKNTI